MPDRERVQAEIAANSDLMEQLDELRHAVEECVGGVLDEVHELIGTAHAAELLSMWEGLGRFTRDALGLEPLTLLRAYRVQADDLGREVRAAYPAVMPDEPEVERFALQWIRPWGRRFKSQ